MTDTLGARRLRPVLAALVAGGGLAFLAAGALAPDLPFGKSLALASRFWRANRTTRLLNAPGFARDAAFARHVLEVDAALPLDADAILSVGPDVTPKRAESLRRTAAYLLAPRRVVLTRSERPGVGLGRMPAGARAP